MQLTIDISNYKAIIFDLGGILLNVNYRKSKEAFEELGIKDFDLHFSQLSQSHLFDRFERGEISSHNFRKELRKESEIDCSDNDLDKAWNAMLLDFPMQRLQLLEKLSKKLPIYLFSNTNEIHITQFKNKLSEWGIRERFENAFTHIYYSFEFSHRKPDPASFEILLNENKLTASETLFIDDSPQHIEGAKKVGLQTILLESTLDITSIFNKND